MARSPDNIPPETPARIHASMDATTVFRTVLRCHFGRVLAREEGARLGEDPEELHKMRVAIRRCESAHRLFRRLATSRPRGLRRELRWVNRRLSRVRDLDVQIIYLQMVRDDLGGADAESLARLHAVLDARRAKARRRMLAAFDSQRWRLLGEATIRWLDGEAPDPDGGGPAIGTVAPELVGRFLRRAREASRLADPDGPIERIHRFRIRTKRLRYCVEFFGDLWGERTTEVLGTLRRAQGILGELNDCEVSVARWGRLADEEADRLRPPALDLIERLCTRRRARADELRRLVRGLADDLDDPVWGAFERCASPPDA